MRYKLYIGSNTDTEPLVLNLKRNNIVVDEYFTSEALRTYKPQKKFFAKILEQIGGKTNGSLRWGFSS